MRTIFKYPIQLTGVMNQHFTLPKGAKIVRFAEQRQALHFWAELETDAAPERRAFVIVGTGHPIPADVTYCASCEFGPFIWHLYEVGRVAT